MILIRHATVSAYDVGEHEVLSFGPSCCLPGFPPGHVDARWVAGRVVPGRLAEEELGAGRELEATPSEARSQDSRLRRAANDLGFHLRYTPRGDPIDNIGQVARRVTLRARRRFLDKLWVTA